MNKPRIGNPGHILGRLLTVMSIFALLAVALFSYARVYIPAHVSAATSSHLNFQARLANANGSSVPDGNYHIEFKLYDGGTSGGPGGTGEANAGTLLWTETRTTGNLVRVVNGYFSVNLGSVNPFPGTINWDQEHWLTINVGGSGGAASFDGEMLAPGSKRTKLTAVPYAFRAGQLAQFNSGTGFTSTLNVVQPTGGNQTFNIPDQGTAGTYSLCIQSSAACGFIQNGTGLQTSANFNISGTGTAATALQAPTIDTATAGVLNVATTNATSVRFNKNVGIGGSATNAQLNVVTTGAAIPGITVLAAGGQTADLFALIGPNNNVLSKFDQNGQLTLGTIAASGTVQQGTLTFADGSTDNFGGTLQTTTLTANRTYTLPDATGTLCLQGASACGFATGSGAAFLQGGNTFSGTTDGDLGTNNNGNLNLRTNNTTKLTVTTAGDLVFAQGANRTLSVAAATSGTVGYSLSLVAGTAFNGTGGALSITGGLAAGTNQNGGAVSIDGGTATGTGTKGYVILQGSGGNVGIGTTTPIAKLEVGGSAPASGEYIKLQGTTNVSGLTNYNAVAINPIITGGGNTGSRGTYLGLFVGDNGAANYGNPSLIASASEFYAGLTASGLTSTPTAWSGTISQATGASNAVVNISTATGIIGSAYGTVSSVDNLGATSIIRNAYGYYLSGAQATGTDAGQTHNAYGIYLANGITASGGATNNAYSIYSASTAASYFAGNVGIGTASSTDPLTVQSATNNQILVQSTGSNRAQITLNTANSGNQSVLYLNDAGANRFQIGKQGDQSFFMYDAANSRDFLRETTAGNLLLQPVGGGTSIGSDVVGVAKLHVDTDPGENLIGLEVRQDDTTNNNTALRVLNSGTGASFQVNDDGTTTDSTPFVIDASGNVGIGTASPLVPLHVEKQDVRSRIYLDTYGDSATLESNITGWRMRGTVASPSATQTSDILLALRGGGYGTNAFSSTQGTIAIQAAENWTNTAQGTQITFLTTPLGSTTNQRVLALTGSEVMIGSSTTDAVAIPLILDSYNNGTDPTGTAGGMYYNTNTSKFRCYQAGAWVDCIGAGSGGITGSGTNNYVARFTGTNTIAVGAIFDDGTNVSVGGSSATYKLEVNGALRLQPSAAPTAAQGVMYFDSTANKFKCSENGSSFIDCIGSGAAATLQTAYTASVGGTTPEVKLDSTRGAFNIQDANTTLGAAVDLFAVNGSNSGGLGTTHLKVQGNGRVGIGVTGAVGTRLEVRETFSTATGTENTGITFGTTYAIADTNLKQNLRVATLATHTSGTLAQMMGILGLTSIDGNGGTTTDASTYWSRIDTNTGATLQNAFNLKITNGLGAGTLQNQYGVYVDDLTKGASTNYAIYTAGTTQSYFGGNVGIGGTSATAKLFVEAGSSGSTGQIINSAGANARLTTSFLSNGSGVSLGYSDATGGASKVLTINAGSSEVARFSSTGNFGIGTTAPNRALTLAPGKDFGIELGSPTGLSATPSTGGTLLVGTYYFKVVAVSSGSSLPSTEATCTLGVGQTRCILSWTPPISTASGLTYRVYKGAASDGQDRYFDVGSGTTYNYDTDVGANLNSPPSSVSAYNVRIRGDDVSYFDGALGIGVKTPTQKLQVTGAVQASATTSSAGTYNLFIGTANLSAGSDYTSFSNRELRVQTSNNLSSYNQYLLFNGNITGSLDSQTYTQGNFGRFSGFEFGNAGEINLLVNTGAAGTGSNSTITPTKALTVLHGGNVGINQTNPGRKLDVLQDASVGAAARFGLTSTVTNTEFVVAEFNVANAAGAQNPAIALQSNGTTGLKLTHSSNFAIATVDHSWSSATALTLAVRGSEKVRINNSGNVGIGNANDSYKLDVSGAFRLGASSAPTAARGVMYFDSTANKFKCSENGTSFIDCIGAGGAAATLQSAYDASTNPEFVLDNTRGAITIRDNSTPVTGNLLEAQNNAGTSTFFGVSTSNVNVAVTGSNAFRIQNAGGASTLFVADTSASIVKVGAVTSSLGGAVLAATTADITNAIRIGDGTNGVSFNDQTANKLRLRGTARNDMTYWLKPEFEGASLFADGTDNTGTITADFCSDNDLRNINATVCPTNGDEHTYYSWTTTQATAQDYDMYIRWDIPKDYDGDLTIDANGWRTNSTSEVVNISLYDATDTTTPCVTATNVATGTAVWTFTNLNLTGCTFAAGDFITFKVHMVASQNDFARLGEIRLTYKSNY